MIKLVLALLLLPGCAPLPVYQKSMKDLSLRDRQLLYERYRCDLNFWDGFTIGGTTMPQWATPTMTFSKYSTMSGDKASAAKARKSEIYNLAGLVAGMAGLAGGVYAYNQADKNQGSFSALPLVSWVVAGISAELVLIEFGRSFHFRPAIKSFNEYLKRDLGLEGGTP